MSHNGHRGADAPINIQTREEVTAHQVAILLNIVHAMRSMAFVDNREHEGQPHQLERETHFAASATLVNACGKLDDILKDKSRWSVDQHNEIHHAVVHAHQKQEELMQANLDLVEMHKRPSMQLRPMIATYGMEYFIAYWGKLEEPGMSIVGRGRTPDEALKDFDKAFHRTPAQQLRVINDRMDSPPPEPDAETPEQFKKKNPPSNEQ